MLRNEAQIWYFSYGGAVCFDKSRPFVVKNCSLSNLLQHLEHLLAKADWEHVLTFPCPQKQISDSDQLLNLSAFPIWPDDTQPQLIWWEKKIQSIIYPTTLSMYTYWQN